MFGGAFGLEHKLKSEYMINLDSEDEGEVTIGSAGGREIEGKYSFRSRGKRVLERYLANLSVKGLLGGHSGVDINKEEIGHSISIGSMLLQKIQKEVTNYQGFFNLVDIDGGFSMNAIPTTFDASFSLSYDKRIGELQKMLEREKEKMSQYSGLEISLKIEDILENQQIILQEDTKKIVAGFSSIKSGVYSMVEKMPGLVQTSNNLGSIKKVNNEIIVSSLMRSSNEQELNQVYEKITNNLQKNGFGVETTLNFPGWDPNPDSKLVKEAVRVNNEFFGTNLDVVSVHAGLECGIIQEKYPKIDFISIGPTIKDVHSPREKVYIKSVNRTWDLLRQLLQGLNKQPSLVDSKLCAKIQDAEKQLPL